MKTMRLFNDLFFGSSKSGSADKIKSSKSSWNFTPKYDDYYEELYDDATMGDKGAQAEMREEFGDDWKCEY